MNKQLAAKPGFAVVVGLALLASACGGGGGGAPAPHNVAPQARAGADFAVNERAPAQLDGSASQDPNGTIAAYEWTQTDGPAVTLAGDNAAIASFTAPAALAPVTLTFRLQVTDDDGATDTDDVVVTVNPVNDAPAAADDSAATDEDSAVRIAVLANDSDPDGAGQLDPSSVTVTAQQNGAASVDPASGDVVFTPAANFSGAAGFQYTVRDTSGAVSNSATVTVSVAAVNDAPTISAIADQATAEDTAAGPFAFTVGDVDNAAATLAVSATSGNPALLPASGITLGGSGANRTISLAPAPEQSGTATVTVTVSDGSASASTAFTLTVAAVDDAPTASDASFSGTEDNAVSGTLSASDIDSTSLTFQAVAQPAHGTVSVTPAGAFSYTPAADYNGADAFTFKASDGQLDSNVATVTLSLAAVNDAPRAAADTATTPEDTAARIDVLANDTDVDGSIDPATVTVSAVSHGTLAVDPATGAATYTPEQDFSGTASFTYQVRDNDGALSDPATVDVTVTAVNDVPVARDGSATTDEDVAAHGTLAATDVDSTTLTYEVVAQPAHGSVALGANGAFTYAPAADYNGADTFTFRACDGDGACSTPATIAITVNPADDAPVITPIADQSTAEDTAANVPFGVSDVDNADADLTVTATSDNDALVPPAGIALSGTGANRTLTLTPAADQAGTAVITLTASDGTLSSTRSFTLTVSAVNDAPTISAIADQAIDEDASTGAIAFTVGDTETAAGALAVSAASDNADLVPPGAIALGGSGADRSITVTPPANRNGTATITVTVSDGSAATPASFRLTVSAVDDAPQAFDDGALTDEDTPAVVDVLANDVDADSALDPASVAIQSESHGVATVNAQTGAVQFLPDANYYGTDAGFTYTVRDVEGAASNVATVAVTVNPVNDAPVAAAQSARVDEDTTLTGTLAASDVDDAALTFAKASDPAHGVATVNADGSFSYRPATNFAGSDAFTFVANDGHVDSAPATVSISVTDVPEATLTVADATVREDGGALSFTVALSRAPDSAVVVHYATADGTARAGRDYQAASGSLEFAAGGPLSQVVTVPVVDDHADENDETLALDLDVTSGAASVDAAAATATGTIQDNDDSDLLRVGAARRSISPTDAQIAGLEEERAFGAGTRLQRFNLGGFGINVTQNSADVCEPSGQLPDGARCANDGISQVTTTEPATRRVFVDKAGEAEDTNLRLFAIEQPNAPACDAASSVPGTVTSCSNVVIFVMIDAIGAGNLIQEGVKNAIIDAAAAQGVTVAPENILFGQTHSHTAADLQGLWGGVPQDWISTVLYKAARDAAAEALKNRVASHLSFRQGYTTAFNNYRRPRIDANADADGTITLLEATADDGTPVGSILQYNAHPTTVGDGNEPRTPHSEYVLGAMEWLEGHEGGTSLYYNGPIADASPSGSRPGCVNREAGSGDPSGYVFGEVRCRGEGIADYLLHDENVIAKRELAPTLEARSTQVVLPITNPAFVAAAGAGVFNRYYNFAQLPIEQVPMLSEAQKQDLPQVAPVAITTVSRITLGGAANGLEIVSIPGETTNTYANYIRKLAKTKVMLLGLTHNSFGYILPEEEFSYVDQEGDDGFVLPFTGYEENVSLGPLTAGLLRAEGYNPLFGASPDKDVPPAVASCTDASGPTTCALTMLEERANLLVTSLENCIENGLTGAGCPLANALDFIGIGGGTLPGAGPIDEPVVDTRLTVASADALARGCDILDTSECLFPFPSDHFVVPAAPGSPQGVDSGGTGKRVNFNVLAMPRNLAGKPIDPTEWNRNDGFSPGQLIVTYVPDIGTVKGADGKPLGPIAGAVPITDLPRYLDDDAPILVLDADTGERHPVYAEIDLNAGYLLPMQGLGPRADKKPALLIRPAKNFTEGHRYVVVLRHLKKDNGEPIFAAPAFTACRDHSPDQLVAMPVVQARCQELADNVFPVLSRAGVARDASLYLAWDFTVASAHNDVGRIVAMRDDAFRNALGDAALSEPGQPGYPGGRAPTYVVTQVTENPDGPNGKTVRRIQGTLTVPSYVVPADPSPLEGDRQLKDTLHQVADLCQSVTQGNCGVPGLADAGDGADLAAGGSLPPNRLNYLPDATSAAVCDPATAQSDPSCALQARYGDGLPDRNRTGDLTTTFTCNIPRYAVSGKPSMADATPADVRPVRPTLYGHGLLGGQGEGNGQASDFGNVYGLMTCMTDWFGFASGDLGNVASALVDLSNFPVIPDGAQQGVLNMMFLARLAVHPDGFAADPNFQVGGRPVFDRREVFYNGNSQGGIMGGVVIAASKDINRGMLGVLGMNYSTLLARSTDFALYSVPLYLSYQDDLERPFVMSLMQMLWDRGENDGYAEHLTDNSAMGGPDNAVLLMPAIGDHQVTMWSAEVMARTVGARLDRHRVRPERHPDADASEYFGLAPVDFAGGEHWTGPALVPYDQLYDPATGTEHWNSQNDSRCDGNRTAPPPIGNVPPNRSVLLGQGPPVDERPADFNTDAGADPHECPRRDPQARCQMSHFLLRTPDFLSGESAPELVDASGIAVFGPSADTDAGCPAVTLTGAPAEGGTPAPPAPAFADALLGALTQLANQLTGGDAAGALATLQDAGDLVVAQVEQALGFATGDDGSGPDGVWLRGDLHVHDDHSADGSGTRQGLGQGAPGNVSVADQIHFAESQRLDFMALNDHRTYDQHYDPLWTSDHLVLLTGEEANGSPHATVFGALDMINQADNPAGAPDFRKLQQSIWDAHLQGAAWSTAHPDDGETQSVGRDGSALVPNAMASAAGPDVVELWNRGTLTRPKIAYCENRWNAGFRFGIAGASDNHFRELWPIAGPGQPTTHLLAAAATTPALLDALRAGRTVINLNDRAPFATLTGDFDGDGRFETVGGDERVLAPGRSVTLRVSVKNGAGTTAYVYRSPGFFAGAAPVQTFTPSQPYETFDFTVTADAGKPQDWYRVELRGPGEVDALDYNKVLDGAPQESYDEDVANQLRAATSPIFISTGALATPDSPQLPADAGAPDGAVALFGEAADNAFAGFADVAEAGGVVHAVAEVRAGHASHVLYRARAADGSLGAPVDLDPASKLARQPAIAASGNDVWVAWQDERGDEKPHRSQVWLRHSVDGGASWLPAIQVSASAARAQRPDLALLDAATPVVVWEDNGTGTFDVLARIVGRDSAPVNLSAAGKTVQAGNGYDSRSAIHPASVSPKVAVRADGAIAVAWQDNRNDEDPGWTGHANTTGEIATEQPARCQGELQRAFGGFEPPDQNECVFTEHGTETDDWEIFAAAYNGSAWGAPVDVSNAPGQADRHATVAFAADGTLHAAWDSKNKNSMAGPRLEIRASRSADSGATWTAASAVAKNGNYSSQRPVLAQDAAGLSLFWMDGRSADWRWRVRRANWRAGAWSDADFVTGPGNAAWPSYENGWLAFTSDRAATREQRKPQQVFLLQLPGEGAPPPDADGDGVADSEDACPAVAGPASNNGCPIVPPPPDADGDGVPDASDQCPSQAGPASNNGCPLADAGGFPLCDPVFGTGYCISDLPGGAQVQQAVDTVYNTLTGAGGTPPPPGPVENASCAAGKNLAGGRSYQVTIPSDSGETISFQVLEPTTFDCANAAAGAHPLILHGHGFGGARSTSGFTNFRNAGYAVISIDQRGHGDSTGTIRVMDPDYEGRDLVRILDWAEANLDYLSYRDDTAAGKPFVARPAGGVSTARANLVAGSIGGSYGGGYQLLLHAVDAENRLDAMAPDITWHDLRWSLNPGDVLKSGWDLLLVAGGERGSYTPAVNNQEDPTHRGLDPYIEEVLARGVATGEFPREALEWFRYHSPTYWCGLNNEPTMDLGYDATAGALDPNTMVGTLRGDKPGANRRAGQKPVDVLFSQGFRDTLFNFNDAWANYQCFKARAGNAADVRLLTHESGHIFASLVPVPTPGPLDFENTAGTSGNNCGQRRYGDAQFGWFEEKLRGRPENTALLGTAGSLCLSLTSNESIDVPADKVFAPGSGVPESGYFAVDGLSAQNIPEGTLAQQLHLAGQDAPAILPLLTVTDANGLIVAGIAQADLRVTSPQMANDAACEQATVPTLRTGCDSIVYVSLAKKGAGDAEWTVLDDQSLPVRGLGTHDHVSLIGVAERLRPGDTLALMVRGYSPQYLASYTRDATLPVVDVEASIRLPLYAVAPGGAPDFTAPVEAAVERGGGSTPPPAAAAHGLVGCVVGQDPALCAAAVSGLQGLQDCSFDESGFNCAFDVVYDAIGVDTAAGVIQGLFDQCAGSPLAPACEAVASSGHGAAPDRVIVASTMVARGALEYAEQARATPSAKSVDGSVDDWMGQATRIGGTGIFEYGEHIYSDFLFDAFGADDGDDARRLAVLALTGDASDRLGRLDALQQAGGDQLGVPQPVGSRNDHYGDATDREDGTDLTEVRWAADGADLFFLARVAKLLDPANLKVVILADLDDATSGMQGLDAGLTTAIFDHAIVLGSGGSQVINLATGATQALAGAGGAVAVSAAGDDNALEARIPRVLLERADGKLRVAVMTVRTVNGALVPANVAYRSHEPVTIYNERAQAMALFAHTVDPFTAQITVADLAGGRTQSARPGPGYHERQFVSGANISNEAEPEQGRLQPYGLFVPHGIGGDALNPARLTIWTHYRGGKAHSGASWTPRLINELSGEEPGLATDEPKNLVVTPGARGTSTWYTTRAHQDFFEVFADVAGTLALNQYAAENLPADSQATPHGLFAVDPAHIYVSGYSMGGYATYLFTGLYPDLFAAGFSQSGAVTQGAWTGYGPEDAQCMTPAQEIPVEGDPGNACFVEANDSRADAQLNWRLLDNTRWVPLEINHGTNDELALTPGAVRMSERLDELGYRHDTMLFVGYEHYTQAIMDEWADGAHYINRFARPENPRSVTYKVVPALVKAVNEVQLKGTNGGQPFRFHPDGAYWVDHLAVRSGADGSIPASGVVPFGQIDAESGRLAGAAYVAVPRSGADADNGPYASTPAYSPGNHTTPYVRSGLDWQQTGEVAGDANTFHATLANLSAATLDLARMGQHFDEAIDGTVTSDGAAVLTLAHVGADMTACVGGVSAGSVAAGADAVITLASGVNAIRLVPGLGASCGAVTPPAAAQDAPSAADVCDSYGVAGSEPACGALRDAQAQLREQCEAGGAPEGSCTLAGGNLHALIDACSANNPGESSLPACRIVDALVTGTAAYCRQVSMASGGAQRPELCALIGGVLVSEGALQRYESSWTHKALLLQNRLGYRLPLAQNTVLHTHNSFNATDDNTPPTLSGSDFNQYYDIPGQLRMDVRAVEMDVHWMPGRDATVATRGREPMLCHGLGPDQGNAGCTDEKPLREGLAEFRGWLDAHPDEVVLLYIEDNLKGTQPASDEALAYDTSAQVVQQALGDLVFRPADHGSTCDNSQSATAAGSTSWLAQSRQSILDAGKQVLLLTERCGTSAWGGLFHQMNGGNWKQGTQGSFDGFAYDSCRLPDEPSFMSVRGQKFTRVWEDSTVVTASGAESLQGGSYQPGGSAPVTPPVMRELMRCGMNLPGVDRLVPADGRLEAAVWSWAKDEPAASATLNCAALNADGRFVAADCAQSKPYACVSDANADDWQVTGAGAWSDGAAACPSGYHFSVPANGYANEELKAAAGGAEVWLNYSDAAADGQWIGDATAAPAAPGSGSGSSPSLLERVVNALGGFIAALGDAIASLQELQPQQTLNAAVDSAAQLVANLASAIAGALPGDRTVLASDCSAQSWIGGTTEICDGVLTYRDYVYDDHGADTQASYNSGYGTSGFSSPGGPLAPFAGDATYPAAQLNTADLVKLELRRNGDSIDVTAELNTLYATSGTQLIVAVDADDDAQTGTATLAGLRAAGADAAYVLATRDAAANTITGSFPLPASAHWKVWAVAAQGDGTVMNVAFRGTEEEAKGLTTQGAVSGTWWEDKQAAALAARDISGFAQAVATADLAPGVDKYDTIRAGLHERIYVSGYTLAANGTPKTDGSGEGIAASGVAGRGGKNNYPCEQLFHFLGKYQPYGLYIPRAYEPRDHATGLQLALHGCSANHASLINARGMQEQFGEALNRVLVVPLGRGPQGFNSDIAERDVLDVLDDVQASYIIDADQVYSGGYSMGGYGALRFAALYPDRFAGAVNWVGFVGDILDAPVAGHPFSGFTDSGGFSNSSVGAEGNMLDFVGNLRHVPMANLYSGADYLVTVNTGLALMEAFRNATQVPYRFFFHPAAEHLTYAAADDWRKEAAYLKGRARVSSPAQVTFRTDPSLDYPFYGIKHDAAYWVSGITRRGSSGYADVDLVSRGCANASAPVFTTTPDADNLPAGQDPVPWVAEVRRQTGTQPLGAGDTLMGTLKNVKEATVDVEASCLGAAPTFCIETDGPTTLKFSDGRAPVELQSCAQPAPPPATLPVPGDVPPAGGPADACRALGAPDAVCSGLQGAIDAVSGTMTALLGPDPHPTAPLDPLLQQCRDAGVADALCARANDVAGDGGLSRWVDPRIGSYPPGFTNPGPVAPFGMVELGPDTEGPLSYGAYYFHNALISGFSHVHMSAGVYKGGYFPVMPFTGERTRGDLSDAGWTQPLPAYASAFDHATEAADAGYYSVILSRYGVRAELTATARAGFHRYTFNDPSQPARVLIDVGRTLDGYKPAAVSVGGDGVIRGRVHSDDAGGFDVWFAARVSQPFTAQTFTGTTVQDGFPGTDDNLGLILDFPGKPQQVMVKLGLSYTDAAGALANLDAEIPGWDFDGVRAATRAAWDRALAAIEVEGGTVGDRVAFYSALYRTLQFPNLHGDVDGRYRGPDRQVHQDTRAHYSQFSSWDSYRGQNQVQAEIAPAAYDDMVRSLLAFNEQAGYLPRWQEGPGDAAHMSGDPIVPFIGEAWCRGALDAPTRQALWPALQTLVDRRDPELALKGYLSMPQADYTGQVELPFVSDVVDVGGGGPSLAGTTLEYGIADFSMALMAQSVAGADAAGIAQRSLNYRNLLDRDDSGFIRPRDADGQWLQSFRPELDYGFQEGTSWQYSWLAMHDYAGVIDGMGGDAVVSQRLDTFFNLPADLAAPIAWPAAQNQATGFGTVYFGNQYAPGNEHDLEAPFVYNYVGEPWKAQAVSRAAASIYTPTFNGLPGNDDLGALSGWLVWAMAGVYPINPGTPLLVIGSPVFEKVTIRRPGGDFVIEAPGASAANKYVQSASIDGAPSARSWLVLPRTATTLHLDMGPAPNTSWGVDRSARPPSVSEGGLAAFGCAGSAAAPAPASADVTVTAGEVRIATDSVARTWSRHPFRTERLVDTRTGKVWSQDSADFSLVIGGVEVFSDQFELAGDPQVQRLPNGAVRTTLTLTPAGFGGAPLGLSITRIIETYPGVAGMRTETWLHSAMPLAISGYSLDEARPAGSGLTGTIHSFRAGGDWREPEWTGPTVSIGDAHPGDWRASESGAAVSGTAQWLSVSDAQDRRLFFVMERNDYASSMMSFAGGRARAHVDLSRDVIYLGPIEEQGHLGNPASGPARQRVVMPGVPLRLEPVFTGFGTDGDDEPWQHYKYLANYRMPPYRREITFNSNGVDSNRISTGAKDDMDLAETQRQAAVAQQIGIETFVLDDGWQARSGDWCPDSPDCREAPRWPSAGYDPTDPATPPAPSGVPPDTAPKFPARFPDAGFAAVRDALAPGAMNLGLWMSPLHFHPTALAYQANPQWGCQPINDALLALQASDPNGGSAEAGLLQWNLEATGPNGKAVDYIEGRIRRAIDDWHVKYFKFDFTVWLDCAGASPTDMYGYRESFMAMLDRILRDHPDVTIQMDETNDYRLFPFEALARGPTWYQNGSPSTSEALHANYVLAPYLPPYALGRNALNAGQLSGYSADYLMSVALLSHVTFFNSLTDARITPAHLQAIRAWTDYYKAHRADLAQFTYPLLAEDPLAATNWAAFQAWNPDEGRGALLVYRQDSPQASRVIRLRNVADGTYRLTAAPDDSYYGTFSGAQLRAGIEVDLASTRTARVLRIERQ